MRKGFLVIVAVVLFGSLLVVKAQVRAQQTTCPGAPVSRLLIGMRAHITPDPAGQAVTPLRIRETPSKDGTVVMQLGAGDQFSIVGGPTCADGFLWWQIVADNGSRGWAAEGTGDSYFIEPLNNGITSTPTSTLTPTFAIVQIECGNAPKTQLVAGMRAIVRPAAQGKTANSIRIRDKAGKDAKLVANLPEGVAFDVVGGPTCADGFVWWQISADNGAKGWTAEGETAKYYIVPVIFLTPSPIPPTSTPAPFVVVSANCPDAFPTRFTGGMIGTVIGDAGVRVHTDPDVNSPVMSSKNTPSQVPEGFDGVLPVHTLFKVMDNWACSQRHDWLHIITLDAQISGYISEDDGQFYSVEPVSPYVTATPSPTASPITPTAAVDVTLTPTPTPTR